MKKTITITDITKVRVGDKAYFKNCDFGFTVGLMDTEDKDSPFAVYNPLSGDYYWVLLSRFDHATREVEVKEQDVAGAEGWAGAHLSGCR